MSKLNKLSEFDFTIALKGITQLTEEVENALFEAGCDDATISWVHDHAWLQFTREANTFEEAVQTAVHDIRKANVGIDVVLLEQHQ
jgi:hypothetical protein